MNAISDSTSATDSSAVAASTPGGARETRDGFGPSRGRRRSALPGVETLLAPARAPTGATLLVEIRSGIGDLASVAALCARCGAEISCEQTDVRRSPIADAWLAGDHSPAERLAGFAILRLPMRRCACGGALPGPFVTTRVELPEVRR